MWWYRLLTAIHTFLDRLPAPSWQVQVFHTSQNGEWLARNLANEMAASPLPRVILTPIPAGHGTSPRNKYSELMASLDLMELVPGDRMLVFQSDALPCPLSKFQISDFFEYDYVGAPWPGIRHTLHYTALCCCCCTRIVYHLLIIHIDITHGGNGGLSMRNKKVAMQLLREYNRRSFDDNFREMIIQQDRAVPHYWKNHVWLWRHIPHSHVMDSYVMVCAMCDMGSMVSGVVLRISSGVACCVSMAIMWHRVKKVCDSQWRMVITWRIYSQDAALHHGSYTTLDTWGEHRFIRGCVCHIGVFIVHWAVGIYSRCVTIWIKHVAMQSDGM